jgi:hypothetical protein
MAEWEEVLDEVIPSRVAIQARIESEFTRNSSRCRLQFAGEPEFQSRLRGTNIVEVGERHVSVDLLAQIEVRRLSRDAGFNDLENR